MVAASILIDHIGRMQKTIPRLIVAIDGLGGAGRSSLAHDLAAARTGARHVEYDWFISPHVEVRPERRFDY